MAYSDPESFVGVAGGLTFNRAASYIGRDRGNVQDQIERRRRFGKKLSKKLEEDLFASVCMIHEEARLHTYPARIMFELRTLREFEVEALSKVRQLTDRSTFEEISVTFARAAARVGCTFYDTIDSGMRLLKKEEPLDAQERVTVYAGAATLHTLVELWEEAATFAAKVENQPLDDTVLDFEWLEIDGIHTALDVAETAFDLYEEAELALQSLKRSNEDDQSRRLVDFDLGVVGANMAALSSYGFDWVRASREFAASFGLSREEVVRRGRLLYDRGRKPLSLSIALLAAIPDHMILARNILYISLQQGNIEIEQQARKRIAEVYNVSEADVCSIEIAGRKPLRFEPHLNLSTRA